MRSLRTYIMESVKTYDYTIRIAGDIDANKLDLFKYNLNKFDPIEIGKATSTPIQRNPYGFPELENQPVTIIKCKFRYPATEPMIRQVGRMIGIDENMIRALDAEYVDNVEQETKMIQDEVSDGPLLLKTDMEETPGAKEASKAYGDSYLSDIKKQTEHEPNFEFAAGKMNIISDPFKYVDNKSKSPMTTIKLPPRPATGANPAKDSK